MVDEEKGRISHGHSMDSVEVVNIRSRSYAKGGNLTETAKTV